VEIEDLTKHYGDVRALDGVSLQAAPGEIFGLLGHNGAGKSTMIRILTGRATPTSGRARVLGHDVPRDLRAVRGQINLVADNPNVYRRATAKEPIQHPRVGFPPRMQHAARAANRLLPAGDQHHRSGRQARPNAAAPADCFRGEIDPAQCPVIVRSCDGRARTAMANWVPLTGMVSRAEDADYWSGRDAKCSSSRSAYQCGHGVLVPAVAYSLSSVTRSHTSSLRTGAAPRICGSSDRSRSQSAYHEAQSGSSPSTIRYTRWCVSPAS
jgi:ABC-type Fe3+/spermidine/putrescine transport system ATPase subunit